MRHTAALLCALALAACGGGSSSPSLEIALQGVVYEVDGQTVDRSGVALTLAETGETVTTGADGAFTFPVQAYGSYTLTAGGAILAQGADDDEGEDAAGNPTFELTRDNGHVLIRLAVKDGEVVEFSMSHKNMRRAASRLEPAADAPEGSEAKVRVDEMRNHDRVRVNVEGLAPDTVVDVLFRDPSDDANVFESAGTPTADANGEASLRRDATRGDTLPGGAATVADMAGWLVEVRDNESRDLLFSGEVPPLPELPTGERPKGPPSREGRGRGKAKLTSDVEDVSGIVMICRWPAMDRERIKVAVEGLATDDEVTFQIESATTPGTFVDLGDPVTADEDGEAKYDSKQAGSLPLDVESVEALVGLEVRVVRGGETIASAIVPELVGY